MLNVCHLCGLHSVNIVREFIFQQDAPAAVLATALYQNLAEKNRKEKKILIFSDSRQDAAFFAPYLEFTYERILYRRILVEALLQNKSIKDYRLESWCNDSLIIAEEKKIFDSSMDQKQRKKEIWKWIIQDFGGVWDRRNSLEGVGLVSFIPIIPENWKPIKELQEPPWNLTEEEYITIYQILMNTLRYNMAINFPPDAPKHKDEFFSPRNKEYRFRGENSYRKEGIYAFIPAINRLNARLEYLQKLYKKIRGEDDKNNKCRELLGKIWEDLRTLARQRYYSRRESTKKSFQLEYRYWNIIQENDNFHIYLVKCGEYFIQCKGYLSYFNCNGKLELINQ